MKPNTTHNADLVITQRAPGAYVLWASDGVIANVTLAGFFLIEAGAIARKLSLFNADTGKFIVGDISQLVDGVTA
jgi:hypothetical protein